MSNKTKLGSDPLKEEPLSFIRDSRKDKKTTPEKQKGRPKSTRVITSASQKGLPEGYTRATMIVNEDQLEKVRAVAYWERKTMRRVLEEALENHLKNRKVKPLPEDSRAYKG